MGFAAAGARLLFLLLVAAPLTIFAFCESCLSRIIPSSSATRSLISKNNDDTADSRRNEKAEGRRFHRFGINDASYNSREIGRQILWRSVWSFLMEVRTAYRTRNSDLPGVLSATTFQYEAEPCNGMFALTLDDCPGDSPENMDLLLDILKENDARATFFITSDYIAATGGMDKCMKRIIADGHEICNHMPEDKPYVNHNVDDFGVELDRTQAIIDSYNANKASSKKVNQRDHTPKLFRPPMGQLSRTMTSVLKERKYTGIILGDVFSNDPFIGGGLPTPSPSCVDYHIDFTFEKTASGSIVIFHVPNATSRQQTIPVLSRLLPMLKEKKGLVGRTCSECAEACAKKNEDRK